MNIKNILDLDNERKYHFALFSIIITIFVMIIFIIIDYLERDLIECIIEILVAVVLIICIIYLKRSSKRNIIYRGTMVLIALLYLVSAATGSGEETILYWVLVLPLFTFSLLGKQEGLILSLVFFAILTVILLIPSIFDTYKYESGQAFRFIGAYLFILYITYKLESSRDNYFNQLVKIAQEMDIEKERLEKSLKEIKTLSGMLPICASCKKTPG
ncbi:MAG: hypothetical protein ACP5FZ_10605 [Fidelibacterota bacterium]